MSDIENAQKILNENDGKDVVELDDEVDVVVFGTLKEDENTQTILDLPQTTENNDFEGIETETGEINWDCPCLGKITEPPCGEAFKEAFSCFFYSKSEPKGSECIDLFRNLRACFDKYPEIYDNNDDDGENVESAEYN